MTLTALLARYATNTLFATLGADRCLKNRNWILTLVFFSWHVVHALEAFVLLGMFLIGPGPVGAGARGLLRWSAIFTLSQVKGVGRLEIALNPRDSEWW